MLIMLIRFYFKTKFIINGQNTDRNENILSIIMIKIHVKSNSSFNCDPKETLKIKRLGNDFNFLYLFYNF
jgi:hypothetical protein